MVLSSDIKKTGFRVEYLIVGIVLLWLSCIVINSVHMGHDDCDCALSAAPLAVPTTSCSLSGSTSTSAFNLSQPSANAITSYRRTHPVVSMGAYAAESHPTLAMRTTSTAMPLATITATSSTPSVSGASSIIGIATSTRNSSFIAANTAAQGGMACNSPSFNLSQSRGITTSASTISGGATLESALPNNAPGRRNSPGSPDVSDWIENPDGSMTCIYCGATYSLFDYFSYSHLHGNGICGTLTPIIDGIATTLFMAILACLYILRKRKRRMVA